MTTIDEIEELRAELRHTHLTATERRHAEARLTQLMERREVNVSTRPPPPPGNHRARNGSTHT
jgi:hypothetical protein